MTDENQNQNEEEKTEKEDNNCHAELDSASLENDEEILKQVQDDRQGKPNFFHRGCKDCSKYKKETEEYKSGWQRALADYKNLQREISERRGEWARLSEQQILEEFIPVYDHLKLAIQGIKNKEQGVSDPWVDGVNHVLRQFAEILKNHGVEEIKTVGEKFDPELHEAVGEEDGEETGKILREIFAGYMMNGKVIRPAKVVVTK